MTPTSPFLTRLFSSFSNSVGWKKGYSFHLLRAHSLLTKCVHDGERVDLKLDPGLFDAPARLPDMGDPTGITPNFRLLERIRVQGDEVGVVSLT